MRPRTWWRAPALIAVVVPALLLSGCGSSSPKSASPPTTGATSARAATTSSSSASGATTTSSGAAPPIYEVTTGKVKGLGTVLVDGQGLTLYMFEPDKQSGTSTCYGACADAWPPLLLPTGVSEPVAGTGVNASLLGVTHRTDGTTQVTYNRWPLYLWLSDSEPGQATGQALDNLGGLWYVLSPDGNPITTHP